MFVLFLLLCVGEAQLLLRDGTTRPDGDLVFGYSFVLANASEVPEYLDEVTGLPSPQFALLPINRSHVYAGVSLRNNPKFRWSASGLTFVNDVVDEGFPDDPSDVGMAVNVSTDIADVLGPLLADASGISLEVWFTYNSAGGSYAAAGQPCRIASLSSGINRFAAFGGIRHAGPNVARPLTARFRDNLSADFGYNSTSVEILGTPRMHHLVFSKPYGLPAQNATAYVDGQPFENIENDMRPAGPATDFNPINVRHFSVSLQLNTLTNSTPVVEAYRALKQTIAFVGIHKRALGRDEIRRLYAVGPELFSPSQFALLPTQLPTGVATTGSPTTTSAPTVSASKTPTTGPPTGAPTTLAPTPSPSSDVCQGTGAMCNGTAIVLPPGPVAVNGTIYLDVTTIFGANSQLNATNIILSGPLIITLADSAGGTYSILQGAISGMFSSISVQFPPGSCQVPLVQPMYGANALAVTVGVDSSACDTFPLVPVVVGAVGGLVLIAIIIGLVICARKKARLDNQLRRIEMDTK